MYRQLFNIILISAVMLTSAVSAEAQTQVSGKVIDENSVPLPFVNVVMLSKADSSFIVGTVTGDDGVFKLNVPEARKDMLIRLSCVGYSTSYAECPAQYGGSEPSSVDMGEIKMQNDSLTLNELVVKGHRPAYRMTAEGISTNVDGTVLGKLGTAEDVLGKVPGIIKKKDGFEVFGKGAPLIFINGRQMRDATELERLKSEDIKSIELITSPGARYDSTVKCVVKIRTKKSYGDGWGFDVRSSYYQSDNSDVMGQLNWNYRHNGLDLFGSMYYLLDNIQYNSTTDTYVEADTLWEQHFIQDISNRRQTLRGIAGMNYAFDECNNLGLKYTFGIKPDKQSGWLNSDVLADGSVFDRLENKVSVSGKSLPSHHISLYYQGKSGSTDIDFNADYLLSRSSEHSEYDEQSTSMESRMVTSDNSKRSEMTALKLTVAHPLFGGKMSLGAEYSHTSRNDDYTTPQQYVPTSYSCLKESHIAPFIEYSHGIGKSSSITLGMRYEHVDFDYYSDGVHMSGQSRSFGNLFPSLSLSSSLGSVQLQLCYSGKTRRPSYTQLSNNVIYGNRFLQQSGNPFLRHEYIHDLSLSGIWKSVQLSVGYNDRRDAVISWVSQLDGNNSVSRFTYINIPTLKSLSASLAFAPRVGIWSPQLVAGIKQQWFTLTTDIATYRMNTPVWQFSMNHAFNFPGGWVLSASAWMTTKGDDENFSSRLVTGSFDASLTRWMLNNRLSVQLMVTDMFKTLKSSNLMHAGCMQTIQTGSYDSRQLVFKVIYRINATRSKYKGTGAGNEEKNRL